MKFFNTIYVILCLSIVVEVLCSSKEQHTTCDMLKKKWKKDGMLDIVGAKDYCDLNCSFLKRFSCKFEAAPAHDFWNIGKAFRTFGRRAMKAGEQADDSWLTMKIPMSVYSKLYTFFAPYMLAFVPLALQWIVIGSDQGRQASTRIGLFLLNAVFMLLFMYAYWGNWAVIIHYATYAFLSAFSTVTSRMFTDMVSSYFVMCIMAVLTLSSLDPLVQTVLGTLCLVVFVGMVFSTFSKSNPSDRILLITALNTIFMVSNYLLFLLNALAMDSPSLSIVRLGVHACLPIGITDSLWSNSLVEAADLAAHYDNYGSDFQLGIFYVGLSGYWTLFLVLRGGIGAMVLASLQFDWNPGMMITGLYSYSIDVINPFMILAEQLGGNRRDIRRVIYAIMMIAFMWLEFQNAREFFVGRFLVMIIDVYLIKSGLIGASRFLDTPFDLTGIAFPKPGAFPFASLDALLDIRCACKRLTLSVETQNGPLQSSGVGTVWVDATSTRLITVKHVIDGKQTVSFDNVRESVHTADIIGDSVDPTVSMQLIANPRGGTSVPFLTSQESRQVAYLFMISPEGMIAPVTNWHFDNSGNLHATVNLKQGDSGSPLIAILNSGVARFTGTVSRGDSNEGHLNLVSSVLSDNFRGSPGTFDPYLDVDNVRTETDLSILGSIKKMLETQKSEYLDKFEEYKAFRLPDGQYDFGDNDVMARKYKARVKNWKKDARAKKQGFACLLDSTMLSSDDKVRAMKAFDDADVMEFNVRRLRPKPRAGLGAAHIHNKFVNEQLVGLGLGYGIE